MYVDCNLTESIKNAVSDIHEYSLSVCSNWTCGCRMKMEGEGYWTGYQRMFSSRHAEHIDDAATVPEQDVLYT